MATAILPFRVPRVRALVNYLQVAFVALVYEKQQNLRIMMKMHGLKDGPYWTITYAYFLLISSLYMFGFVAFGSILGSDTAFKLIPSLNSYLVAQ